MTRGSSDSTPAAIGLTPPERWRVHRLRPRPRTLSASVVEQRDQRLLRLDTRGRPVHRHRDRRMAKCLAERQDGPPELRHRRRGGSPVRRWPINAARALLSRGLRSFTRPGGPLSGARVSSCSWRSSTGSREGLPSVAEPVDVTTRSCDLTHGRGPANRCRVVGEALPTSHNGADRVQPSPVRQGRGCIRHATITARTGIHSHRACIREATRSEGSERETSRTRRPIPSGASPHSSRSRTHPGSVSWTGKGSSELPEWATVCGATRRRPGGGVGATLFAAMAGPARIAVGVAIGVALGAASEQIREAGSSTDSAD